MKIWKAMLIGGLAIGAGSVCAQTVTILHEFTGLPNDGREPFLMHLIQGSDGNFYGTTIIPSNVTQRFYRLQITP